MTLTYTTPVTDRTLSDILNRTAKGFMNVADWVRIYNNARIVRAWVEGLLDVSANFETIATPTTSSIPLIEDVNKLTGNIENIRVAVASESIPGASTEIKDDWQAGPLKPAVNYEDVNLWESTLDAIWDYFDGQPIEECPTLSSDLTVLTDTQYVVVDCLDMEDFNVDLQGTARLAII